jgi:hypothetical protein
MAEKINKFSCFFIKIIICPFMLKIKKKVKNDWQKLKKKTKKLRKNSSFLQGKNGIFP